VKEPLEDIKSEKGNHQLSIIAHYFGRRAKADLEGNKNGEENAR
jgi:hypothetical protein